MKHGANRCCFSLLLVAGLFCGHLSYAADIHSDAGTRAFPSLKIGVGAEAISMGESGVALADDAYATYWNVAGLAYVERTEIAFMNNEWILDIRQNYAAVAQPLNDSSAIGASLSYMNYGELVRRDETGNDTGTFRPYDLTVGAGIGFAVSDSLALGLQVKFLRQQIDEVSASGLAIDLGARYDVPDSGLSFGASVQHLGTSLEFETVSFSLPTTVRAGIGYRLLDDDAAFVADVLVPTDDDVHFGAGFSYAPADVITLRGGYRTKVSGNDLGTVRGLTGGFGLHLEGLSIDYAFVLFGDLGPTNRVSLSAVF